MIKDTLDHARIFYTSNGFDCAAALTSLHINAKYTLETLCPCHGDVLFGRCSSMCIGILFCSRSLTSLGWRDVRAMLAVWSGEPQINPASLELASIATPHVAGYSLEGKQNGSWQVYQIFCERFGFVPKQRKDASEDRPEIEPSSISEMLLSVYDPRVDDERMRKAFIEATKEERKIGSWFDSLRRDYPQRRECFTSNCIRP